MFVFFLKERFLSNLDEEWRLDEEQFHIDDNQLSLAGLDTGGGGAGGYWTLGILASDYNH